jgi:hypothetical protein
MVRNHAPETTATTEETETSHPGNGCRRHIPAEAGRSETVDAPAPPDPAALMKWVVALFGLFLAASAACVAMSLALWLNLPGFMPYAGIAAFIATGMLIAPVMPKR